MSEFIVHSIVGSPFARAVLATLEEKGAPWRLAAIVPGQHRAEAHLRRHPFGKVPVLEHDGFEIYETQAILRYLDRVLPAPPLTPAEPRQAARMDQLMNVADCYLYRDVGAVIGFERVVAPRLMGRAPDEAAIAACLPRARTVIGEIGRQLGERPFMVGAQFSLADLLIASQLEFLTLAPEWPGLVAHAPLLDPWMARMNARPSLIATTWDRLQAMQAATG